MLARMLLGSLAIAAMLGNVSDAAGRVYPSRPITIIVPFPAGGPTDAIARILAERMRVSLGQPLIIENVSGASGSIGVGRAARAAPDGYTLSIGHLSTHVLNGAVYSLQYDVLKDFEPVSLLATIPQWLIARNDFPAKDARELIAWLRANPDKASAATVGLGSASHLAAIYFQNKTDTRFRLVPYRGAAPALIDLIAGQIDMMFGEGSAALQQVRSGKIKAFAVLAKTRWFAAPDIATGDELGVPGLYLSFWHGLWVPKGTSQDIIVRLNAAVSDAFADPVVRQRLADLGQEIPSREQQTPEALGALQ